MYSIYSRFIFEIISVTEERTATLFDKCYELFEKFPANFSM